MAETPEMQQGMTAYFVGRATGKTVTLVKCAHKNKTAILCQSVGGKANVLAVAEALGINVDVYLPEEFNEVMKSTSSADVKK